jgi:hypothetical protein
MRGSGFLTPGLGAFDHVMKQLHDFALVQAAHGTGAHRLEVVGDAADLHARPDAAQRLDHLGADLAGQQPHHVATGHLVAERAAFVGERGIEGLQAEFAALQLGPGVVMRIGRIDGAQEILGQAARRLVAGECLEGTGRDHTAEIPDHCLH